MTSDLEPLAELKVILARAQRLVASIEAAKGAAPRPPGLDLDDLIDVETAADLVKVHPRTIRNWINKYPDLSFRSESNRFISRSKLLSSRFLNFPKLSSDKKNRTRKGGSI